MRRIITALTIIAALAVSGCESCNGGVFHESAKISDQILHKVERICGEDREHGRGGVENIMLMEDREDDGIVTCHDGTNHYFDA